MERLVTDEWARISEKIEAGEKIEFDPAKRPCKLKREPNKPVYVCEAQQNAVKR